MIQCGHILLLSYSYPAVTVLMDSQSPMYAFNVKCTSLAIHIKYSFRLNHYVPCDIFKTEVT